MKIGIVGAGIVGASIAYHLGKAGAQVTVFDIDEPGNGVSSTSFACLNAFGQEDTDLDIRLQAIRYHDVIAREVGSEKLLNLIGTLRIASSEKDAEKLVMHAKALRDHGSCMEFITASKVAELEPLIKPHLISECVTVPEEGWVAARSLCQALMQASTKRFGVRFRRERILGFDWHGTGMRVSHLLGNQLFDVLVLAAGNETNSLLASAGLASLSLTTDPGPLLSLTYPKGSLDLHHVVYADNLHIRPGDYGGFLAGVTSLADELPSIERLSRERAALIDAGDRWINNFSEMQPVWSIGVRPMPNDGTPMVGAHDDEPRVYVAAMHGGITLGPLIGQLLASEILGGYSPELRRYRPRKREEMKPRPPKLPFVDKQEELQATANR